MIQSFNNVPLLCQNGISLVPVTSFNFIRRVILGAENHWPAVVRNCRKHGGNGSSWRGWWEGRVRMTGPRSRSTWQWSSWSCCTFCRCGWWTPTFWGCWVDSTTWWPVGWRGDKLGKGGTACGYTPCWRTQLRRRDCRSWRPLSPSTRPHWHSLLQLIPLWTSVWLQIGDRGHGCLIGGVKRTGWTWRGCRRRLGRQNGRKERRRQTGRRKRHTKLMRG